MNALATVLSVSAAAALCLGCAGRQDGSAEPVPQPAQIAVVVPATEASAAPDESGADAGLDGESQQVTALGSIWGDSIGEAFGAGGLGLSGIHEGGGGRGEASGLGGVGTIGRGSGVGTGSRYGRLGGSGRIGPPPSVATGDAVVNGSLDRDVIRRVVRRHMNRMKYCYERELVKDASLQGKVVIRFVIDREGSVSSTQDTGSTMPNAAVVACVQTTFRSMQFPKPAGGGVVVVTYPVVFASASPPASDAGAPADAAATTP